MNKIMVIGIILVMTTAVFAAATFSMNSPSSRSNGSSDLVSYWAFDEGNGTTAYDSIGDNDGTIINGAKWVTGQINDSLSFDGDDDHVLVSHDDSLNMSSTFTIEAWINISGNLSVSASPVVAKSNNYYIFIFNDRIRFGTSRGTLDYMTTPVQNKWTFLTALCNGTAMQLYVNGDLKQTLSITGTIATSISTLTIGSYSNAFFYGLIDEVKLFDSALSVAEVKDHFENLTAEDDDDDDDDDNAAGNHTCQEAIDAIDKLIQKVKSYNLSKGTENSFVKKLENAEKSLVKENHNAALGKLGAFINHAEAQSGKKLTEEQADEMIADAEAIIDIIKSCPP